MQSARLHAAIVDHDRRESKKRGYNPHALGQYCAALQRVDTYVAAGHDLRSAIITCFIGRLCDKLLVAAGLPLMSDDEARFGLANKLPEIDE